jgi:hypothetical protein
MFICLKKIVCCRVKHRIILSLTYCNIYGILVSSHEEFEIILITTIVHHVLVQTHKNDINFRVRYAYLFK